MIESRGLGLEVVREDPMVQKCKVVIPSQAWATTLYICAPPPPQETPLASFYLDPNRLFNCRKWRENNVLLSIQ